MAEELANWLINNPAGNATIGIVGSVFFFIFCGCFCLIWSNHQHLAKSGEKEQTSMLERLTSHFEVRTTNDMNDNLHAQATDWHARGGAPPQASDPRVSGYPGNQVVPRVQPGASMDMGAHQVNHHSGAHHNPLRDPNARHV